jgi:hypothetical protein
MKKTLILLLIFTLMLAAGCAGQDSSQSDAGSYVDLLFDNTVVHTIDITMSEEDRVDASEISIMDMGSARDLQ